MITITSQNFELEIKNATKPVVVDAFATWCGPCKLMEPAFEELAAKYSDKYIFAKLNVDEASDLAIQFGVTSVPTLLFFKEGQLVGQHIGYMSKEDLESKIEEKLA